MPSVSAVMMYIRGAPRTRTMFRRLQPSSAPDSTLHIVSHLQPLSYLTMRFTAILVALGAVATCAATPVEGAPPSDTLESASHLSPPSFRLSPYRSLIQLTGSHTERAGCPNTGSQVACDRACDSVVRNACKSCNGNPSCLAACEHARYQYCYACCKKSCTTC